MRERTRNSLTKGLEQKLICNPGNVTNDSNRYTLKVITPATLHSSKFLVSYSHQRSSGLYFKYSSLGTDFFIQDILLNFGHLLGNILKNYETTSFLPKMLLERKTVIRLVNSHYRTVMKGGDRQGERGRWHVLTIRNDQYLN